MDLVTLDFETFWTREYSLSKLSVEDYVCDERFQIILCAYKVNDEPARWFTGTLDEVRQHLADIITPETAVLGHNVRFDGCVTTAQLKLPAPKLWLCTRSMAKALLGQFLPNVSLHSCLEYLKLPYAKGDATQWACGLRREDFSPEQLKAYADYCVNDVEATYALFRRLALDFPPGEYFTVDLTTRMYLEPQIVLDADLLLEIEQEAERKQEERLAKVAEIAPPDVLSSNLKFAALLEQLGVEVPMKTSPQTGNLIPALAKQDPGFKDLCDEYANDELITALLDARRGQKSRQEVTRARRLREIALRYDFLRVPLLYHSAHTTRYGGDESINLQNLPRVYNSRLRYALKAPPGHVLLAADLSQIEARWYAYLSGQSDLLGQFARKEDPYAIFASQLFHREIKKGRDTRERDIGKEAILAMGFGVGATAFRRRLRGQYNIVITEGEAEQYVEVYRSTFHRVPKYWRWLAQRIEDMYYGAEIQIGPCCTFKNGVRGPDGLALYYPDLRDEGNGEWTYLSKGRWRKKLYGGKLLENLCQFLAQRLLVHYEREIYRLTSLRVKLQVHDEIVFVVREKDAEVYAKAIEMIITRNVPSWAAGLPVACEVGWAQDYGSVK